jgi:hypothetical protein
LAERTEKTILEINFSPQRMATTNNDPTTPVFHFHPTTFGPNIRLENNASKAVRHSSFDHGILFHIF